MPLRAILTAVIFFLSSFKLAGQTNFTISVKGGINYTPMRGIEHDIISWEKSRIDRFNYSAIVGVGYSLYDQHSVSVEFEQLPINLSYSSSGLEIQYQLKFYSLTFGYDYKINIGSKLDFYLGTGAGYILLNSKVTSFSDIPDFTPDWFKDEGLLLSFKFGGEYYLNNLLSIAGEIRYRYVESLIRSKYFFKNDVNLSGISLLIGFNLNF